MAKGIVCQCLCQGLNMWLGLKHGAYCLCCGFQFQWQNKLQEFLLVRKSVFAYVYLSWYLLCVYAQLQNSIPHTWRNMYIYTGSWSTASSLWRIEKLQQRNRNKPLCFTDHTKSRTFSANLRSTLLFNDLTFLNIVRVNHRPLWPIEKPTPESFVERIKMIYRNSIPSIYKTRNCMTSVYHQSWLQKADSAVLPWTLMRLWAAPRFLLGNITEAAEGFLFPWPESTRCQTLWIHHQPHRLVQHQL